MDGVYHVESIGMVWGTGMVWVIYPRYARHYMHAESIGMGDWIGVGDIPQTYDMVILIQSLTSSP